MKDSVEIEVIQGDALATPGDVLALKYAQDWYGVDWAVAQILMERGVDATLLSPKPGESRLHSSDGHLAAQVILFIGVPQLDVFGYQDIRVFSRRVLSTLAGSKPETKIVVATIHGANYGFDELEAFEAEIAGFVEAIRSRDSPQPLEKISIVERDVARASRLQSHLEKLLPGGIVRQKTREGGEAEAERDERLRAAGYASGSKPHVFVAMPFKPELDDYYHYGIQGAVRDAGFLCERADLSAFTGDVLRWVQDRIRTASLIVADLTDANPNVYLEVGYAWRAAFLLSYWSDIPASSSLTFVGNVALCTRASEI
jgi:hypothetical protein